MSKNNDKKYKKKYMATREFSLSIQEPYLTLIKEGKKPVEGRPGEYKRFKNWIGKDIIFFNSTKNIKVNVTDVKCYKDLYEYLEKVGYKNAIPNAINMQEAIDAYHKFYTDEKIKERGGMCGIFIKNID